VLTTQNSIPFGCDMSGVFPKWLNIVRGQAICCFLSWAICPWLILTSGAKFIQFLGSYTFFMAAVLGILVADYYVVRKGNYHVCRPQHCVDALY
jgi:NCS1 family nucleobase:cation symporter-1